MFLTCVCPPVSQIPTISCDYCGSEFLWLDNFPNDQYYHRWSYLYHKYKEIIITADLIHHVECRECIKAVHVEWQIRIFYPFNQTMYGYFLSRDEAFEFLSLIAWYKKSALNICWPTTLEAVKKGIKQMAKNNRMLMILIVGLFVGIGYLSFRVEFQNRVIHELIRNVRINDTAHTNMWLAITASHPSD